MSNMNFNCDVCGREVQGCTLVNGMKFCAKCYQETFGETEKDRKINDLQSQLAEKERQVKVYAHEIAFLDNKLEKKEKEIEELHTQIEQIVKDYTSEIAFYTGTENQKAIEQLEKVKENIHYLLSFDYNLLSKVNEQFDNQINELKGKQK